MSLGKGLESLIPPINPFKKPQDEEDRKQEIGDQEQVGDGGNPLLGADTSRTEHPAGSSQLGLPTEVGSDEPRAKKILPLEQNYSVSDREVSAPKQVIFQIETDKIKPNPHQPRRDFNKVALEELANSIREFGIIQPLVVTKVEKESARGWEVTYELVAGERRLMAAKLLGLRTVPAIVRQVPKEHEKLELAVTENVQRANLNPIEFARAIAKLQEEFRLTQREVAARLGKSREAVANTLRLLSLPTDMQEAVAKGSVSESQARLLLSVEDPASRDNLFQEILKNNLTVREATERVREMRGGGASPPTKSVDPEILSLKEEIEAALGAPVELKRDGAGGKLTINFYSKEELEGILAKIKQSDNPLL